MRYYISLYNPQFYNIESKLEKEINEKILLSFNGLYKIINDALFKFKLYHSNILDSTKIINTHKIYCTDYKWIKCKEEEMQIPYEHSFIKQKKSIYRLHPKSLTAFIIEKSPIKIDYYFLSKELPDNHSLIEDINAFLALLM